MQFTAVPPRVASGAPHVLYAIERLRFDCMTRPRPRSARVRGLVVVLGPLLSKKSNRTNSALLIAAAPLSPTGTICVYSRISPLQPTTGTQPSRGEWPERPWKKGPTDDSQLCTHRNSRVVHTLLYIRESLVAASSSCPSRSDSLFLSRAHVATWTLTCRISGLLAAHLARRIISASVREKRLHQRVELDRVINRLWDKTS